MPLTPRQIEAQKALQDAIEGHRAAFLESVGEDPSEVLTDWALVSAYISYGEDGHQLVCYHYAFPDDQLADHRAIGLFEYASNAIKKHGDNGHD